LVIERASRSGVAGVSRAAMSGRAMAVFRLRIAKLASGHDATWPEG